MPFSVTFTNLSWSTPLGRPLFTDLNLAFGLRRTGLVGRNGTGKTTLLKLISGELQPRSGKVAINGRMGYLRQAVSLKPGETIVDLFCVPREFESLRRAEAGAATVEELSDVDWGLEGRLLSALSQMQLEVRPDTPLDEMSGGQRTRASLAAVIFAQPDCLLLDEPTNHLDREGRRALIDFLSTWRKGAIVVSHDRELLEVMDEIVELTTLGATKYGGNWSRYQELKQLELAAAKQNLATAEKRVTEVARGVQVMAERKARRDAAGRQKKIKGGIPRIALGGLKNQSEMTGGANARLAERLQSEATAAAAEARRQIEVLEPISVVLPPTGLPAGKQVLELDSVTAGYAPGQPILRDFSLHLTGPERLAVTGPNGCGKSTLVRLIDGSLPPWAGTIRVSTDHVLLDQEVRFLDPSMSIWDNYRRQHPEIGEQAGRASLARFGFRAADALRIAATLSGGQLLRAGLACVLGGSKPPPFLILDEPTNHLDLDAIKAMEAGLSAYDGALLVVSHDEAFLREIGITRRVQLPPPAN